MRTARLVLAVVLIAILPAHRAVAKVSPEIRYNRATPEMVQRPSLTIVGEIPDCEPEADTLAMLIQHAIEESHRLREEAECLISDVMDLLLGEPLLPSEPEGSL